MAENAVIGALRVVLGADSAQLEDGFKRAQKTADTFGKDLALAAAAVGVAVAAMATAIGVGINRAIAQADNLGKMSQKIGIPVEQLSALRLAAELSDVSLESLGKGVAKLSKTMVEAAAKPMSDAANAFRALGVSVTNSDGTLKSSATVMEDIAGKFENMKDGAGKTAVSIALFGRAGAEMIPLLNSGRAGLADMAAEAKQFGIVIDTQTAKSAEAFNDNLKRLSIVKEGIIMQITARMLPALQALSQHLVDSAKSSDVVGRVSGALVTIFEGLTRAIMVVVDNFGLLITAMGIFIGAQIASIVVNAGIAFVAFARAISLATIATTLLNAAKAMSIAKIAAFGALVLWATGNLPAFTDALKKVGDTIASMLPEDTGAKIVETLKGLGINLDALTKNLTTFTPAAATATVAQKDFNFAAMAGKNALDGFIDSTNKSLAAQNAEILTTGLATGAKERMQFQLQATAIALSKNIKLTPELKQKIDDMGASVEGTALKLRGAHLVLESKEPHEKYRIELENNEAAMRKFGATSEEIARMQQQHAEKYANTWAQVGESAAGSFVKIGESFGKENKAMAMTAKVAGIIQGTISMFTGAAKALELPFPANLGAMAAVLATGAGLVASIRSTAVGGFKTGGAIVPGGMGGGDRVRAMVDLEPGEQLDVWRPGDAGGDPRRGGGAREITIHGLSSPKQLFTQNHVREFIQMFNEAIGDGARLRFT